MEPETKKLTPRIHLVFEIWSHTLTLAISTGLPSESVTSSRPLLQGVYLSGTFLQVGWAEVKKNVKNKNCFKYVRCCVFHTRTSNISESLDVVEVESYDTWLYEVRVDFRRRLCVANSIEIGICYICVTICRF